MAANRQSGVNSSGWTKWQIALVVGTPIALGLGYWYYRSHRQKLKRFGSSEERANGGTNIGTTTGDAKSEAQGPMDLAEKSQMLKNKGNKLFKSGKYDEAINCYTEAILACAPDKKEDLATFYQNRAAAYEQLKNYVEVINDCSSALDLNSRYSKALNRRAKAYEVTKDLQKCLEDITAVCILDGFQSQPSLMMADRVLKQLGRDRASEAMKKRQPQPPSRSFVKSYFSSFSNDPIAISLKETADVESGDISGYFKARQDLKQDMYDNIIEDCSTEILRVESAHRAHALLLRATFNIFMGLGSNACKDLTELLKMNDVDKKLKVNAMIKLGSLRIQEDDPDKAMEMFEQAIQLDPANCDIYHHRGQFNLIMERIDDAMRDFNKAVELNPHFPIAYVQKCYADCRYAAQQPGSAALRECLELFEKALVRFPNCVEAFTLYGQVLTDRQEYDRADECFEQALQLDPDNATIYVHRGLLYLQWKQDVGKAVDLISEAIKRDDKCEFGFETLGTIEVQRGNLDQAVELFGRAIALAKTEAEMAHLYSLNDAALAQAQVAKRLGIQIPQPVA